MCRGLGNVLLAIGQDIQSSGEQQLRDLIQEFMGLYAVKIKVDPRGWRLFFSSSCVPEQPDEGVDTALSDPERAAFLVGKVRPGLGHPPPPPGSGCLLQSIRTNHTLDTLLSMPWHSTAT